MRAHSAGLFALVLASAVASGISGAAAMPASCEKDFAPMMEKRQGYINTINGYNKRKPTASQACNTFQGLSSQNKKMTDWMVSQKDWCQIPEDMVKGISDAQVQLDETRGKVCSAAAKQAQQLKQMKARAARQQPAQPGVGSGVRLPQGAL